MLLVDIDMPKDCPFCPMAHYTTITDEFTGCDAVGGKKYAMKDKEYAESVGRPSWCPIKGELKEGNDGE